MTEYWYHTDRDALQKRLRRVEGQVRGLQRMVEEDAYCIDILTQISAANRALQAVALNLLEGHLAHCVAEAGEKGGEAAAAKVKEATEAIARLVRSLAAPAMGHDAGWEARLAGISEPTTKESLMTTQTYTVTGMTCGHCVKAVTEEVAGIDGVTGVDIDLASGAVTVTSQQPLATESVRAAVDEAGYELAGTVG